MDERNAGLQDCGAVRGQQSSYFYQKRTALRPDKYKDLRANIKAVSHENFQCYGYRRIHTELRKGGKVVSEMVIRRIIREGNLLAHCARRRRYSSYIGEISPAVANIVNRDFHADAPNKKWLTDLTEYALPAGKVNLSPVIDCFDGSVVSWMIGTSPNAELANAMLDRAIARPTRRTMPPVKASSGV